jgi:hypothetical protein
MPTSETTERHPTPLRRLRRKLLFLGAILLLPVCLLGGGYAYLYFDGVRQLKEATAEVDRLDSDWRLADLEAKRIVLPDAENGMLQALAAARLLPKSWPEWPVPEAEDNENYALEVRSSLSSTLSELPPPEQLNDRGMTALRAELQRAAPALVEARKLAGIPNGRFPIAWPVHYFDTVLPDHVQHTRAIASLLSYDTRLRAQDRDLDGALTSCHAGLNLCRAIGDEPRSFSQLVHVSCQAVVVRSIERVLAQGEPSAEALARIQRAVGEEAEQPVWLFALRGERAGLDYYLAHVEAGDTNLKAVQDLSDFFSKDEESEEDMNRRREILFAQVFPKRQHAALLRYMTRLVEIAKLPPEKRDQEIKQLEATRKDQPVLVLLCEKQSGMARACQRTQAEMRCAFVALALERYRQKHQSWPETLTALVPQYLNAIPTDPFDGKPLRYCRFDQGVTVYSVGYDGVDNGGQIKKNPTEEDADLGFRLWDVAHRRQPARPWVPPMPPEESLDPETDPEEPEARHRVAEFRCGLVATALMRYRAATGRWPESLGALVPGCLAQVPNDPFDGKPLRYRRFAEGVVVYSVGYDGIDNGGQIDKPPGTAGADIGFRLWDVPTRRPPGAPSLPKSPEAKPEAPAQPDKPKDKSGQPSEAGESRKMPRDGRTSSAVANGCLSTARRD